MKCFKRYLILPMALIIASCNPLGGPESASDNFGLDTSSSQNWDFSAPGDYTYNTNHITIASGAANLKTIDTSHSGADFNSGTFIGTKYSGSKLVIKNQLTTAETHVDTLLPAKAGNLIGYWRLNDNLIDEKGSNNGSFTSTATYSTLSKLPGKSVELGQTNTTSVNLGSDASLDSLGDFSYAIWYQPKDITATGLHSIVSKRTSAGGWGLGMIGSWTGSTCANKVSGALIYTRNAGAAGTAACSNEVLQEGIWYHFAVSYNQAATELKIWINGELVVTDSSSAVGFNPGADLIIGHRSDYNTCCEAKGHLDEFSLWNTTLTDADADALYQGQVINYTELNSSWTPQFSSLIANWKMDGTWIDSVGVNHLSAFAGVTFSNTRVLGASSGLFDGVNDYISTATSIFSTTDANQSYTGCLWAKIDQPGSGGLITQYLGGEADRFALRSHEGKLKYWKGGNYLASSSKYISDGVWRFLCFRKDINAITLFIDGAADGTGTDSLDFASAPFRIGIFSPALSFIGNIIKGNIDNTSIWNSALTNSEISLIYNRQKQKFAGSYESEVFDTGGDSAPWAAKSWITELPFEKELTGGAGSESSSDYAALVGSSGATGDDDLMSGIVGLWHFNEANGTTGAGSIIDSSGNNYNGTPSSLTLGKKGILGKSGTFSGTNSGIELPSTDTLIPADSSFSFSVWFKTTTLYSNAVNTGGRFITLRRAVNSSKTLLGISGDNINGIMMCGTGCSPKAVITGITVNDGKWHHAAGTYNKDTGILSVYFDGGNKQTASGAVIAPSSAHPAFLGASFSANTAPFKGSLDEVAIWNRALTDAEVSQLYRRGANRLKLQVRSCDDSSCAGEQWSGPNNATGGYYFSELNNCDRLLPSGNCDYPNGGLVNLGSPDYSFSNFTGITIPNNRYFQYRVLMESDDESAALTSPSLTSINLGATKYYGGAPSVITNSGQALSKWTSFSAVTSGPCSVTYQASLDKITWYYWDGVSWAVAATASNSNSASDMNANASSFIPSIGAGSIHIAVFLNSDTTQSCSISSLEVAGEK